MHDVFIIGGGINGCGIARDAAGRGFSVLLAEKGDLASGTSSGSTKLIHGGLRYLEHYEFRLVREALKERERLWAMAPHIVWPLRFVLPYQQGMRPTWLLRLGLLIYDHLGGRGRLPPTRTLDLRKDPAGRVLKDGLSTAFEYSDCWVDDARLVVLNAQAAADHGASIHTRTAVVGARRGTDHWQVTTRCMHSGEESTVAARMLINAAGPWVDDVLARITGSTTANTVRHVQGSHVVVPKLFDHDRCYIFQLPDERVFFAIPYEQDFTLLGTTDRDYQGAIDSIVMSDEELDYICAAASSYFAKPVRSDQVVWSYSAVRPLYDDGASPAQEATRDYVLKTDGAGDEPRLINIFGGKITTYRKLAEAVLAEIEAVLGRRGPAWTGTAPLPGGDFPADGVATLTAELVADYPFLSQPTVVRLIKAYGTRARDILGNATSMNDLGELFGSGLSEREVAYLQQHEWAETTEDILWRRSKLGLRLSRGEVAALSAWLAAHAGDGRCVE